MKRNIQILLAKRGVPSGSYLVDAEALRRARAVQVLEGIATQEAFQILQTMVSSSQWPSVSRAARHALGRLNKNR